MATTTHTEGDGNDATVSTVECQLQATITSIDRVIFQLSDANYDKNDGQQQQESSPARSSRGRRRRRQSPKQQLSTAAPIGLEKQFQELYNLLHPCLIQRQIKSNVTALLMGMRGSGKTLLLERCLASLHNNQNQQKFRIVRLNGLLIQGQNVGFAVKEIVRQLSDMAMAESRITTSHDDEDHTRTSQRRRRPCKRPRRQTEEEKMEKLLRLRHTSFTSNLALLDEALKIACVDSIPILIVLDEMDAFLGSSSSSSSSGVLDRLTASSESSSMSTTSSDQQLLLYHLLDRVATQGSYLSLVGITSHLATVGMLEKRVKSRAEGTSKIIYIRPTNQSFDTFLQILQSKMTNNENDESSSLRLKQSFAEIMLGQQRRHDENDHGSQQQQQQRVVRSIMQRHFKLGQDIRWFCRVLTMAFSLYQEDVHSLLRKIRSSNNDDQQSCPSLKPQHLLQALDAMGASSSSIENGSNNNNNNSRSAGTAVQDLRVQALLDLTGPQLAILLAAKRILSRDAQQEDDTTSLPKPLTMERMLQEYKSYRGHSNRYNDGILQKSLLELMALDVIRPSADHSGGGPLQYDYSRIFGLLESSSTTTIMNRIPLHVSLEMDRELGDALKNNLLDCSTALREWGKKMN